MNPSSRIKISALDPAVNAAIETIGGLFSFLKGDSRAADKPGKRMGQIHLLTQYGMPRVGQAAFKSEVQCGQRVALIGTVEKQ